MHIRTSTMILNLPVHMKGELPDIQLTGNGAKNRFNSACHFSCNQ